MSDVWKPYGITISILIILSLLVYAFSYISRECNTNLDCSQNYYCAYNNKCYPMQTTSALNNLNNNSLYIFIISILSILILSYFSYKTLNKGIN